MSNLAHGSMRIRGKEENILLFLRNELKATFEDLRPTSPYACDVRREERAAKVQILGNKIRISRESDTLMGFHFMAENYGQFLHAFDRELSFTAPIVDIYKETGTKLVYLDRFSARYETIDTEWFCKVAKKYEIDIRIFLSEFESGVPDDEIYCYTFLKGEDNAIVKAYGTGDQLWYFPDKKQMHAMENAKKQVIKDRIGG